MADGRINSLTVKLTTSQLATYYSTLRLAIDDPSFTGDTPYILVSDLFLNHETRITDNEAAIAALESDVSALNSFVENFPTDLEWQNATKISASLLVSSFMRCSKRGNAIALTGQIAFSSVPSENTILFTLPEAFPAFTETHYFSSVNGGEASVAANELKAVSGTRNIVMGGGGSTGTIQNTTTTVWL